VKKRRAGPATLLAFGSPALPECCAMQRVQTLYKGMDLNEVSSEAPEFEKLQTANRDSRSRFYTGAEAQKSRVTSEVKNYDALHLGTPAILDHRVPMQSQIIFSPESGSADDGVLKLWEVTKLNSKAQVVVLSNATFAQRDAQSGNALIALNWAWFVAGTPAVILSRWQTEPAGVADFMTELHRGLKQSKNSHAQTLRESVLKLRRSPERENPYHWSGFMILGGLKSR
jgi:CHAT domain-containing protein